MSARCVKKKPPDGGVPPSRSEAPAMADTVMWPKATPFCGRHFLTRRSAAKPVVPKQGLKKAVAEEPEESSVARHHGSRFAADPARMRRRGRRPRRQGTRKRARRVRAAFRMGRWRGTWLLSKFREQRGVFMARGMTVCMTDSGCAWEEPEGLAQNLAPQAL